MKLAQTLPVVDSWGMHGDVGTGWWIVMMVGMLVFWAAVLVGIVWMIRGPVRGWSAPGERPVARESPREILDRRFAEGAITPEDYQARRTVLVNGSAEPSKREEVGAT